MNGKANRAQCGLRGAAVWREHRGEVQKGNVKRRDGVTRTSLIFLRVPLFPQTPTTPPHSPYQSFQIFSLGPLHSSSLPNCRCVSMVSLTLSSLPNTYSSITQRRPLHSPLLHGSNQITSNSNGKSSDSWSTSVHMANSLWHGSQSTPQYPKECAISPTLLVSWACS